MKKIFSILSIFVIVFISAQTEANQFYYELTFKPKKDSARLDKVIMSLDITKDKSIYRDYTVAAQDSILKVEMEAMMKSGMFKDLSKTIKQPKFSEKIYKFYPDMTVQYTERIAAGFQPKNIGYNDDTKFEWNIQSEKAKIGNYSVQKATTEFGGRSWVAWFTSEIPFPDGPYKFHGLPGLIVKIEDEGKNYSWELKGNKTISDYKEQLYIESIVPGGDGGKVLEMSREKFEKTFGDFKKDPLATARPHLTPDVLSRKVPGSDQTIGELMKIQEDGYKKFYGAVDNPIELTAAPAPNGKKKK